MKYVKSMIAKAKRICSGIARIAKATPSKLSAFGQRLKHIGDELKDIYLSLVPDPKVVLRYAGIIRNEHGYKPMLLVNVGNAAAFQINLQVDKNKFGWIPEFTALNIDALEVGEACCITPRGVYTTAGPGRSMQCRPLDFEGFLHDGAYNGNGCAYTNARLTYTNSRGKALHSDFQLAYDRRARVVKAIPK